MLDINNMNCDPVILTNKPVYTNIYYIYINCNLAKKPTIIFIIPPTDASCGKYQQML